MLDSALNEFKSDSSSAQPTASLRLTKSHKYCSRHRIGILSACVYRGYATSTNRSAFVHWSRGSSWGPTNSSSQRDLVSFRTTILHSWISLCLYLPLNLIIDHNFRWVPQPDRSPRDLTFDWSLKARCRGVWIQSQTSSWPYNFCPKVISI